MHVCEFDIHLFHLYKVRKVITLLFGPYSNQESRSHALMTRALHVQLIHRPTNIICHVIKMDPFPWLPPLAAAMV